MKWRGSFRTKLSLAFVVTLTLVAILLTVVMPSVIYLSTRRAMPRITEEMNRNHLALFDYLLQSRLSELALGVELAFDSGVPGEWLDRMDRHRPDLEAWLRRKQYQLGLSFLTLVGFDGRTVARATHPGSPQDRVWMEEPESGSGPVTNLNRLMEQALNQGQGTLSVEILSPVILRTERWLPPDGLSRTSQPPPTLADVIQIPFTGEGGKLQMENRGLTLLTVQPIRNQREKIVGAAVAGHVLNRDLHLLAKYHHLAQSDDASIYLDSHCIASNPNRWGNFPTLPQGSLPDTIAQQLPLLQGPKAEHLQIGGFSFDVAYAPLHNGRREIVGLLLVGGPTDQFEIPTLQEFGKEIRGRSWQIMVAEVLLCGLLSLLLAYILANRLLTPLAQLRDGARLIGAGNFDHRLDIRTGDEFQELAEDFNEMAAQLAEARRQDRLALVGRMASTIIHDLRNPLTTILGYAPLLEETDLTRQERQNYVRVITDSSNRITDMVQDLLDFARGQERALSCELTTLSGFLKDLEPLLRRDFERSPVSLELTVRQDGMVSLDSRKMQRVLINLASNAREALGEGGHLRIEADVADGQGLIRVIDDGPGIPEEIRDRLFQPFVTHGKRHGTGLGLTICQQFVEGHGGTLEVDTATGQGTTFTIRLPLAEG